MKQIIYADNAATTKLNKKAYEAMLPYLFDEYGNPSQAYSLSRASKSAIKAARESIAKCINSEPEEIFFTSGGTESDNWAIKGVAFGFDRKKAIITSCVEHHAVLRSCEFLERLGYPVVYLSVTNEGEVLPETLERIITHNTGLVSVMYGNNEIGTIQPIKELAEIAHKNGALFHTDAVQAVGHVAIDVKELGVDLLSAAAHKFGGPKGVGFLYIKKGTNIVSYLNGGAQEHNHRAGTENVASIVGMSIALEESTANLNVISYITELENQFYSELETNGLIEGKDYIRNGKISTHLPGIINVSFKKKDGEAIMHRLDLKGIMISTGSACDSVNTEVSHVIKAISVPDEYAQGTIRISLNSDNSKEEVTILVDKLQDILSS